MSQHGINHKAYIGLGSNLARSGGASQGSAGRVGTPPIKSSAGSFLTLSQRPRGKTRPARFHQRGGSDRTDLTPQDLLKSLLEIEHYHGRVRECRNGPRTLDLDILLYDDLQCNDAHLTLPHPRMHQRAFVLQPLCEIAPDCRLAGHGTIAELLKECSGQQLERVLE